MNLYWLDFQALKRGDGLYLDSAIAALILRLKPNGLMKFISRKKCWELFSRLSGELSISNADRHTRIFCCGRIMTRTMSLPLERL
jgi:hypothetical protein